MKRVETATFEGVFNPNFFVKILVAIPRIPFKFPKLQIVNASYLQNSLVDGPQSAE